MIISVLKLFHLGLKVLGLQNPTKLTFSASHLSRFEEDILSVLTWIKIAANKFELFQKNI